MADETQTLDMDTMSELRTVMGDDFNLLLDTFRKDSEERVAAINEAVADGIADEIRRAAHSFKGSASHMGAMQLANLCGTLEELGRSDNLGEAGQLAIDIANSYKAVEEILTTL